MSSAQQRLLALSAHLQGSRNAARTVSAQNRAMRTLEEERQKMSFDVALMEVLLDGGEEAHSKKKRAMQLVNNDRILNEGMEAYDYSTEEARYSCTRKMIHFSELAAKHPELEQDMIRVMEYVDPAFTIRWFVQRGLWIGTILNQGSDEQQAKWLPGSMEWKRIGCFGMTELTHSSFLRGAETTATYDASSQEFVINSPSITASKWWIGQAGQAATHCIVFANLVVNGEAHGIQLFITPVRDPVSGEPLPGVTIGDLGPKYGRHGNDNGLIMFDSVRIPRENMLARWAQVDADGTFHAPPSPALAYGSTILERVSSLNGATVYSRQALLIATRYSLIRRQGEGDPQVMDFQVVYSELLPHIATLYAYIFAAQRMSRRYEEMVAALQGGDEMGFLGPLPDMHAMSCGMKAVSGWWTTRVLERCRRALGGHGYHAFSGIPRLIADWGVVTTGGGDNYVILQQLARYALKTWKKVTKDGASSQQQKSKRVAGSLAYFSEWRSIMEWRPPRHDPLKLETLHKTFQLVSLRLTKAAAESVQRSMSRDQLSFRDAWNESQVVLGEMAKCICYTFTLQSFLLKVRQVEHDATRNVLKKLCLLFAASIVKEHCEWFMGDDLLLTANMQGLNTLIIKLARDLRAESAGLVDAFGLSDEVMRSPLSRADGNIYEHYFAAVRNSRIGSQKVAPYWDELIRPRTSELVEREAKKQQQQQQQAQ